MFGCLPGSVYLFLIAPEATPNKDLTEAEPKLRAAVALFPNSVLTLPNVIGPEAGSFGGEVVATGNYKNLLKSNSLTAQYLNGTLSIKIPAQRRTSKSNIQLFGARQHNLKNIDVQFPLGCFTAITGVSGSGKSTLVKKILYPAILKEVGGYGEKPGQFSKIEGNFSSIKNVEFVNQNPIGRSSRSNPVTYIKAYDDIRSLFSKQKLAIN